MMKYYSVYRLKDGFTFCYPEEDSTINNFVTWCFQNNKIDEYYYQFLSAEQIKARPELKVVESL